MMKPKAIIWGASGHAAVVAEILQLKADYELIGFLDDTNPALAGKKCSGLTILGGREKIPMLRADGVKHIAFGFGHCLARLTLFRELPNIGFNAITAIHPSAVVSKHAMLEPGVIVMAGAVVNPGSQVGAATIVNTASSIDHDCRIGAAVHIAPGARLAGWVEVGEASWIGIGAVVNNRIRIGANTTIGAGAVVIDDIPAGWVAYGCPARPVRKLNP